MSFERKVEEIVTENQLIHSGERVTVAFSGGADSTALLLSLYALKNSLQITLSAIHINHMLRGTESVEDADFCKHLCSHLHIPLQIVEKDAMAYSVARGLSLETGAREMRYEIFDSLQTDKIATAHNADDLMETVLFHWMRGTGLKGLCGIPIKRDRYIRPLLYLSRKEVEEYLSELEQSYRTDSSNLTDHYARNQIRHHIIPEMKKIRSEALQSVGRACRICTEENDYLEQQAKSVFREKFHKDCLCDMLSEHRAIRMRCLGLLCDDYNIEKSTALLNRMEQLLYTEGTLEIKKGLYANAKQGNLQISFLSIKAPYREMEVQLGENELIVRKKCILNQEKYPITQNSHKYSLQNTLDCDKIKGKMRLHTRKNGDRIKLAHHSFTSMVKKLLQEKIPKEKRGQLYYISDDEGLIYMESVGVADRVICDSNTKKIFHINITCE